MRRKISLLILIGIACPALAFAQGVPPVGPGHCVSNCGGGGGGFSKGGGGSGGGGGGWGGAATGAAILGAGMIMQGANQSAVKNF
jgi:hypothetical protein